MLKARFYLTAAGGDVVRDEIRKLPEADRRIVGEDLATLQHRYPLGMPLCRPLRAGLWELRSSLPSRREFRMIYFFDSQDQNIVVVHAFIKKSRATPDADLRLAERRKAEYS